MKTQRQENVHTDIFTPRSYQVELLHSALKQNTIACLGTGTGKTFLSVMLVKELARQVRPSLDLAQRRHTVFLVSNDTMLALYAKMLRMHTDLSVLEHTNEMDSDEWDASRWQQELVNNQVLVLTGVTFLRMLNNSFIKLSVVNLIIFDQCHYAVDDHPYVEIMNCYKPEDTSNSPRILGLTASVLKNNVQSPVQLKQNLAALETTFHSIAETASDILLSDMFAAKPKETVIECDGYVDTTGLVEHFSEKLESVLEFLEDYQGEGKDHSLMNIPKTVLNECHYMLHVLGPWCAGRVAGAFIIQLTKLEAHCQDERSEQFLHLVLTVLRYMDQVVGDIYDTQVQCLEDFHLFMSPRVLELVKILQKYKPDDNFVIISDDIMDMDSLDTDEDSDDSMNLSEDEEEVYDEEDDIDAKGNKKNKHKNNVHYVAVKRIPPENPTVTKEVESLCGIIFVERQHTAFALNKLLVELCNWDPDLFFIKSNHITGHPSGRGSEHEILYKKQEDILRKFRQKELNLLISTSVLEEGVDVPRCNVIIRFDVPKDYRSYVQSKGRARAPKSHFYILMEQHLAKKFEENLSIFKGIEEVLLSKCHNREEVVVGDEPYRDEELEDYFPGYVTGGGGDDEDAARVSMLTAIGLINRYCAKLPSDAFTHLTPKCTVTESRPEGGETQYTATLQLPINSPIKQPVTGKPMLSKRLARMHVALMMCEILHKSGELDDNLMPIGKEMIKYEDEENEWEEAELHGQARPGTTKRKQYYYKRVAEALLGQPKPDQKNLMYIFNKSLACPITEEQNTRGRTIHAPEDTPRGFGIISEKAIPLVPQFPVFTRSGEVTLSLDLVSDSVTYTEEELDALWKFHRFVFSKVLRLEKDPMVFDPSQAQCSYVVVPLTYDDEGKVVVDWQFMKDVDESPIKLSQRKYLFQPNKEKFQFNREDFHDAVVMPSYRNIDQPQYFYVAEIRDDLTPKSPFPSPELYDTFEHYYRSKYGLQITFIEQPLIDVDHTSARLNLLTPRYMNQKGVALPTSSAETRRARRENLQQKQILIPELCDIHPFPASLWRKAVCIPAILYRINYLLIAEELRMLISEKAHIGVAKVSQDHRFPPLEFGFSIKPTDAKPLNSVDESADQEQDSSTQADESKSMEGEQIKSDSQLKIDDEESCHENGESNGHENLSKDEHESTPGEQNNVENVDAIDASIQSEDVGNDDCVQECIKQVDDLKIADECEKVNGKSIVIVNGDLHNGDIQDKDYELCSKSCETKLLPNGISCKGINGESSTIPNAIAELSIAQDKETNIINMCADMCSNCHESKEQSFTKPDEMIERTKVTGCDTCRTGGAKSSMAEISDLNLSSGNTSTSTAAESKNDEGVPESLDTFDEEVNIDTYVGPSPCILLQTLTMSNANDFFNLERLETIGDSFLKFAITVYLYCTYPGIHEGKLSYLRSKQVSNYNLYKLGKKKSLPDCMVAAKFEPTENWLPPGYIIRKEGAYKGLSVHIASNLMKTEEEESVEIDEDSNSSDKESNDDSYMQSKKEQQNFIKELKQVTNVDDGEKADPMQMLKNLIPYNLQTQHSLPDKSIADCVEALIGCYLTSCGQRAALQFMSWLGLKVLPDLHLHPQDQDEELHALKDPFGLLHAPVSPLLTHVPEAKEILHFNLDGYSEFEKTIQYTFKDKSYLLQAFTHASYHYNNVTDCYQRLEFLGDAILDYVITRHLFEDSKKHSPGILTDLRSALVNNNIFAALAVKWDFHKYFKAISPHLFRVIDKFVTWQKDKDDEIGLDDELEDDDDDQDDSEDIEIPKALGDIFESVAGAIYLDSGMSLNTVWKVYHRMMKPQIDAFTEKIPKSPVRELLEMEPETAKFEKPERTMNGKIRVTVNVVGKGTFSGIGRNYRIAKSAAARRALKFIKQYNQHAMARMMSEQLAILSSS